MKIFKILQVYILYVLATFSCKNEVVSSMGREVELTHSDTTFIFDNDEENQPDRVLWQKPEMILKMLGDISNKNIADIGSGSGFFTFRFLPYCKTIIASDIDLKALKLIDTLSKKLKPELSKKLKIALAKNDDPNLGIDTVDIFFLSNTYIYLKNRIQYLKNIKKYSKDKGQIVIVDYKKKMLPFGPAQELKLEISEVENDLIKAGYQIYKVDDTSLDYQYIVLAGFEK